MAEARTGDTGVGMTGYVASHCGKCLTSQHPCHEMGSGTNELNLQ